MSRCFFCKYSDGQCVAGVEIEGAEPILWAFLHDRGRALAKRDVQIIPESDAGFFVEQVAKSHKGTDGQPPCELMDSCREYNDFHQGAIEDAVGFISAYPRVAVPFLSWLADEKRRVFNERCLAKLREYHAGERTDEMKAGEQMMAYGWAGKGREVAPPEGGLICPHEVYVQTELPTPCFIRREKEEGARIVQSILDHAKRLVREGYPKDVPEGFWQEFQPTGEDSNAIDTPTAVNPIETNAVSVGAKKPKSTRKREMPDTEVIIQTLVLYSDDSPAWVKTADVKHVTDAALRNARVAESHWEKDGVIYGVDKQSRVYCRPGRIYYYYAETMDIKSRKFRDFYAQLRNIKPKKKKN